MNQAVDQPGAGADHQGERDGELERQAQVLPQHAQHDGAQAQDRARRQVDAAGDDDHGHRQGHQPDLAGEPALVEQVVDGEELLAGEGQDQQRQGQDGGEDRLLAEPEGRARAPWRRGGRHQSHRLPAPAPQVGQDGDQDQHALDRADPVGRDVEEDQRAGDGGDQDGGERRAHHRADAAQDADPADDRGGDDGELEIGRHGRLDDRELGREQDRGDAGEGAVDQEHLQDHAAPVDAGEPCRLGIAADRVDAAAEAAVAHPPGGGRGQHHHEPDRHGDAERLHLRQGVAGGQVADPGAAGGS